MINLTRRIYVGRAHPGPKYFDLQIQTNIGRGAWSVDVDQVVEQRIPWRWYVIDARRKDLDATETEQ